MQICRQISDFFPKHLGEYALAEENYKEVSAIRKKYISKQNEADHYRSFGDISPSVLTNMAMLLHYEKAPGINITNGSRTGEAVCYDCSGSVLQSINNTIKSQRISRESACDHN